jgi:G:T-mismatch repair DNA endonuclease (very short patch repair protein)
VERDSSNFRALRKSGWKVRVIWECETKSHNLANRLRTWLK